MSNGSAHYRRAEALIARADGEEMDLAAHTIAQAAVHANLAVAGALIGAYANTNLSGTDATAVRAQWFGADA